MSDDAVSHEDHWDSRYAESERMWSGRPNVALVRAVEGYTPGTALDLGCGEGADAIWLAERGWRVTGADVSGVALRRAAAHASDAGVAERVDWQRHDLGSTFPEGTFDLVSAHYLHDHGDMPRERILRGAAAATAPGGVLLVVGHTGGPAWADHQHHHADAHFPTPNEVLGALELPPGEWEVLRSEEFERTQDDPEGRPTPRTDNLLMVRRLPA
ncbi:class I SAM-dependent methyltransferase [Streptomyces sp. AJS327]|uniref:class I SAM-dependent methyltransferase n=1 Tax=Streptomyces sp. AJS327 TaxID=2545265 RepID=UPI0015DF01E4|nr:class I SAM-dependent methyltransferase [Streptomyces sp. AJS327]MBA0052238.1 class I SAM-dependent methyltransferase [Streptomyces sp. AJS327]